MYEYSFMESIPKIKHTQIDVKLKIQRDVFEALHRNMITDQ